MQRVCFAISCGPFAAAKASPYTLPFAQGGRKTYPVRTLPDSTVDFVRVSAHHRSWGGGVPMNEGNAEKIQWSRVYSSLPFLTAFSFALSFSLQSGVGMISRNAFAASKVSWHDNYAGPCDRETPRPTVWGSSAEEGAASMKRTVGWQFAHSPRSVAGLKVCQ